MTGDMKMARRGPKVMGYEIGREYWETLSAKQRWVLIESHGGFDPKHATQEFKDLTPALQHIACEAAITPGGIVKLDRLIKLKVLNPDAFPKPRRTYYWQYLSQKCIVCEGNGSLLWSTGDPKHPLKIVPCPHCDVDQPGTFRVVAHVTDRLSRRKKRRV